MRYRKTALAGIALLSVVTTVQAQKSPRELYPLKKGTTWTYSTKVGATSVVQNVIVSDVKTVGSHTEATIEYRLNDQLVQSEVYQLDNRGISRRVGGAAAGGVITPPLLILPSNTKPGTKWAWKGTIQAQGQNIPGTATFIMMPPEKVTVPSGTFNAYRVRFFLSLVEPKGGSGAGTTVKIENSYWFAPNVGIVKQEVKVGPQTIMGVLTKYNVTK